MKFKIMDKTYTLKDQFTFRGIMTNVKDKFKPQSMFLIEFTHYNGTIGHYTILANKHKFEFKGQAYIIDERRKIYNNAAKMYMLRYHEGFVLPYSVDVDSQQFKKGLPVDDNSILEVSTSYNPYVLVDVLKMEYAKGVIQGAEVSAFIRRSFVLLIIILVAVLGHFLIAAYKSGWFGGVV